MIPLQYQNQRMIIVLSVLLSLTLVSCGQLKSAVYYKEANRAHNRKDFDAAIELYKKSIEAKSTNANVQYDLGVAYLDNHNYTKANQQIQKLKDMGQSEMAAVLQELWHQQKSL